MSRIRSVHPGLFTDEDFVGLSEAGQIFYIGLLTEADDQGVFEWKPTTLRMRLRPTKDGPVEALLSELESADRIAQFAVGGRKYGAIRNFRRYQRPKSPSATYPLPPELVPYVGLDGAISETRPGSRSAISEMSHSIDTKKEELDGGEHHDISETDGADGACDTEMERRERSALPKPHLSAGEIAPQRRGEKGREGKEERDSSENPVEGEKTPGRATAPPRHDIGQAFDGYNAMAKRAGLSVATKLTESRRRAIRARLDEHGLDGWNTALAKTEASPFLRGQNSDWRAGLDFLLQPSKLVKVIEGAYDARAGQGPGNGAAARPPSGANGTQRVAPQGRDKAVAQAEVDAWQRGIAECPRCRETRGIVPAPDGHGTVRCSHGAAPPS